MFGKFDWIITRGMLGFGPLTALGVLLWQIYDGRSPTFRDAATTAIVYVFVCGPLWGLFMWWRFSGKPVPQDPAA
jgi:hypothetical protein